MAPPKTTRVVGDPAFSSIEFKLLPGETILGGEGRMILRSGEVNTQVKSQGIVTALSRALAGEGLFINEYTGAGTSGGMVAFGGIAPGAMVETKVKEDVPLVLSRNSFICCDSNVVVGGKFNFRGIFEVGQEEGAILPRAVIDPESQEKEGRVWLSAFGHLQKHNVPAGQSLWVDNGCFVACTVSDPSKPPYKVDTAVKGLMQAFLSGEGFAMRFEGPNTVWTQNRNLNDFARNVGRLIDPPSSLDAVETTGNVVSGIANFFSGGEEPKPARRSVKKREAKKQPTKKTPSKKQPAKKQNEKTAKKK